MKIDGRAIATEILEELARKGTKPTLAVIQVGNDESSTTYINQKIQAASRIGGQVIHERLPSNASETDIASLINKYNGDPIVHGLILQRPVQHVALYKLIDPSKDVDGFLDLSPYTPPVAGAVLRILEAIGQEKTSCVVIGKGETAGKPISETLQKRGWKVTVVHSKTEEPERITKQSDVVISCVGKKRTVTARMVHKNTILIGVGLWRDSDGKLQGDYDEEEIKDIVAYYTPTPGGVGPVNVACLMENLVKASTIGKGGDT